MRVARVSDHATNGPQPFLRFQGINGRFKISQDARNFPRRRPCNWEPRHPPPASINGEDAVPRLDPHFAHCFLLPQASGAVPLRDLSQLKHWIIANAASQGIDTANIAVTRASAGALMAALAAAH